MYTHLKLTYFISTYKTLISFFSYFFALFLLTKHADIMALDLKQSLIGPQLTLLVKTIYLNDQYPVC